jgi:nanoRNase/pAp phosphatase (c-di-AMP/oligoRNAs hydrolase)
MRYVLVSSGEFLWELLGPAGFGGERAVYVVEEPAVRARIARRGARALSGDLGDVGLYRRAFRTGHEAAIVAVRPEQVARVVAAVREAAPTAPAVVLAGEGEREEIPGATTLPLGAIAERVVVPEVERAVARARVERIRRHFEARGRILLMMQDDPDPDAIASALALKKLLGRGRTTATLATFGSVRRPENRAMLDILEIEVERIAPDAIASYDAVAMVDTQPAVFEERFPEIDLVVDHHPERVPVRARLKDIRPGYGATSTILTEYLRAVDAKISPRLATALLYGIKADTLQLERDAGRPDMDAFAFLHALANHSALRRIERPALPAHALDALAAGLARRRMAEGVLFAHVGAVAYPELVAQFADLLLQVEGAEWSVVSGIVDGELHASVRNVGYVRSAGDVVRQAFGAIGSAGGHRSMAKAVIRLQDWRARVGDVTDDAVAAAIAARFLDALGAAGGARARG